MANDERTRFDPYHKWLGIPPEQQPADHYRLLGLKPLEDDLDVIANAADRQMSHLKTFAAGQHSEVSQVLLNEVAQARLCLLNPRKKRQYDQQQRERMSRTESPIVHTPKVSNNLPELRATVVPTKRRVDSSKRRRAINSWALLGIFLVVTGLFIGVLKVKFGETQVFVDLIVDSHARESENIDGVLAVNLDHARSIETTVSYQVSGDARLGEDYLIADGSGRGKLNGVVTVPAGQTSAKLRIKVIDDQLAEGKEYVSIAMAIPSDSSDAVPIKLRSQKASLAIYDDDQMQVSIKSQRDGNEAGPVEGFILIEQSHISSTDTIVRYSHVANGKDHAISGKDIAHLSGTITIPAGQTSIPLPIRVIDDSLAEEPEMVRIKLGMVSSGRAAVSIDRKANQAELLILDNDKPSEKEAYPLELQLSEDDPRRIKDGSSYFSTVHPPGRALRSRKVEEITEAMSELDSTAEVKAIYQRFLEDLKNQSGEESRAIPLLESWYLDTWLAEKEENQQLRSQLESSLKEAARLVNTNRDTEALQEFRKAKRIIPDDLEADFTIGLISALVGHNPSDLNEHLELANKSFTKCINTLEKKEQLSKTEQANLQAAFNNLAILQVTEGHFGAAIGSWTKAIGWGEVSFELFHNIQVMAKYVQENTRIDSKQTKSRSLKLLQAAREKGHYFPIPGVKGWMFMPYLRTPSPDTVVQIRNAPIPMPEITQLRKFNSGYGFAVKPGYLITHRSVVHDAVGVMVIAGGKEEKDLIGYPVASSAIDELVLLKVDGLDAQPLSLAASLPQQEAELSIVGFRTQVSENHVQGVLDGIFHTRPDAESWPRTNLILAAISAEKKLIGMPLLDQKSGHVVGLVGPSEAFQDGFLPAVTSPALLRFLREEAGLGIPSAREWANAQVQRTQASKSTFQLVSLRRPSGAYWKARKLKQAPVTYPVGWNGLEYRWCWNCYGFRSEGPGKCPHCRGAGHDRGF